MKLEARKTAQKIAVLAIAACMATPSHAAADIEPQALLYLSMPLDSEGSRTKSPSVGFMLRKSPRSSQGQENPLRHAPLVDISVSGAGYRMRMLGVEAYRSHRLEDARAAEPSAALAVVGIVGVVVVAQAAKKNHDEKVERQRAQNQAYCNSVAGMLFPFPCVLSGKSSTPQPSATKAK